MNHGGADHLAALATAAVAFSARHDEGCDYHGMTFGQGVLAAASASSPAPPATTSGGSESGEPRRAAAFG
jgi:hypothetical protein